MSTLHIFLFGKFQMQCGQQVLTGLDARKVQELFCYLLLYRGRSHPRETLTSLLWGDSPTSKSKRSMRQTLWQLQATLDCQTEPINSQVLLVEPDWIQVNSEANFWFDVAVFEQAFDFVRHIRGRELDLQRVQALQNAVNLYRGDLLEGWYQDWCLYERERLQNMYLAMLDKLMGYCEAHSDYENGLIYGARILHQDRARERTHRRLMRLQYMAGDRTAALRQYERCVAALAEELGVKPAQRTVVLYEQMRTDQLYGSTSAPAEVSMAPQTTAVPLPEILGRLKHLHAVLTNVQRQVQQDIEVVERALNDQH